MAGLTGLMPTSADALKVRISSSMSLEQAMAEVRRYLDAKAVSATAALGSTDAASIAIDTSQLALQAALLGRLSEIATRLGQVEPNSKLGPPGVFLKRVVRKLIGWYSRPVHEFDRAVIELLQQIRLDMLGLQQQISVIQQAMTKRNPATLTLARPKPGSAQTRVQASEQPETLALMIELFKNIVAVEALRQALRQECPELLLECEELLAQVDEESQVLKTALLRRLEVPESSP